MKKIYTILFLCVCVVLLQSGVKSVSSSSQPPTGYTGATGNYCNSCHSGLPLNAAGGSIIVTGLPTGGYTPGATYPLSLKISHNAPNRRRWGFSIKAVNTSGAAIGSFTTTNANASVNGTELAHNNAVTTSNASNYTYANLNWIAPASAGGTVTFYYAGNAASGLGDGTSGDYIYAGSTPVSLPIELNSFKAVLDNNNVVLKWQTANEVNSNYFDVERSDDGQFFFSIGKVDASGNSSVPVFYNFTDTKLTNNNGSQIFYRLKLVDKDGTSRYSNNVSIKPVITGVTIKNIYPTVIRKNEQVTVDVLSDKVRNMDIIMMDETGRALQVMSTNLMNGNNTIKILPKVDNLKGMLFVKFSTTNFQQTKALILQ
ncbi:MAG: choice-of-anchor V domain-containing protein [Chitinophagaceae bacterium]